MIPIGSNLSQCERLPRRSNAKAGPNQCERLPRRSNAKAGVPDCITFAMSRCYNRRGVWPCRMHTSLTTIAPYLRYIRMTTAIAKVFKSGNSQALRLPKAFRLSSKTVRLVKTPDGFAVRDEAALARRIRAFVALAGSCPDFPEIPANLGPNIRRHWE